MSFDTVFNYTSVTTGLKNEQNENDTALAMISNDLNTLQSASAYTNEPVVADRITSLQESITLLTNRKNDINAVLSEISKINALPAESKDSLLYFYTVVNPNKQDYMSRMLFNCEAALSDTRIANLMADTTTPSAAKNAVARVIYDSYTVSTNKYVLAVYRYPN